MWFKKKNEDPLMAEMRKKSTAELEAIVSEGNRQQAEWFVQRIMGIMEIEKRIHEMKFHGREGGEEVIKQLKSGLDAGYKNMAQWLSQNIRMTPNDEISPTGKKSSV